MALKFKTNEEKAAELVFDFINENQPDFDLQKFVNALRSMLISEHQCAVRNPASYTPEEYDFWEGLSYESKVRL